MGNENGNLKKDYLWNAIGSGVYALAAMVLAFAVMHIAGPDDGGVFSFGYSTFAQQIFIIAYFGIRPFQITDAKYEYSFREYGKLRVLTSLSAAAAAFLYLGMMHVLGTYTIRKAAIVFLLALYKIADGVADLYESECQRAGFLWIGGKEMAIRTILSAGLLVLLVLLTKSVLIAVFAADLMQLFVILCYRSYMRKHIASFGEALSDKTKVNAENVKKLARNTVLLFLSVFVDFYVFSASKYAIDMYLTDADSGIFNILFMPTSVIYLVSNFVIKPYMTRLSSLYEEGDIPAFEEVAGKLKLVIVGLSVLAVAGTIVLGKPVLGILELLLGAQYKGMLSSKLMIFVLIILGGCFYAMTCLYYYLLTMMRQQKAIFVNYLIVAAAAFMLTAFAVPRFGQVGAGVVYPIYMCLITILFMMTSRRTLAKAKN